MERPTRKPVKTRVGGSRVVEKIDVKKKTSKKKVSKKTGTNDQKGKDNVS